MREGGVDESTGCVKGEDKTMVEDGQMAASRDRYKQS